MRNLILAGALLAGACTTVADRAAYLNTLVGQPESELVRALGVPSRVYEAGGHKFLAYTEQRREYVSSGLFFGAGGGYYNNGFGFAGAFPTEVVPRVCETTFDVVGGRVMTWALRGNACG